MTTTRPYWAFDGSPIDDPLGCGERAVRFFAALRHPLSMNPERRFGLHPFWERVVRRIYGPRHPDGRRIVRTVFIMIPRGARKTTTIGAGLGLFHAIGHERVPTGQVFLAAGAADQAEVAFDEAVNITRATPALKKVKIRGDYIEHPEDRSRLTVLSSEGDLAHGKTPAAVFLDELHIWKNRKLWRALKTGMVKAAGSLLVITTTAGRGQSGLAWDEYQYARRVALGEIDNPAYLPIILEPPPNADWRDEHVWHMVNPGLADGFPVIEEMRQAATEAAEKPGELDDFRQYNLNMWIDSAVSPFVETSVYDEGGKQPVDLEALKDRPCWLAVDLSSNTDLTVIVAAWPDDADGYDVASWFFCPKMNLRERQDRTGAPYLAWEKDGLVAATPGNVVDFGAVETKIRELCDAFDVREIAFDPALARSVMNNLGDDGLPVVEHRQGSISMMPALAELERAIVGRKLRHGGNPVLRFCIANVEAVRNTHGHLVRLVKSQKWLSIDGAVAAAMAVHRASHGDRSHSIFDDPDFDPKSLMVRF